MGTLSELLGVHSIFESTTFPCAITSILLVLNNDSPLSAGTDPMVYGEMVKVPDYTIQQLSAVPIDHIIVKESYSGTSQIHSLFVKYLMNQQHLHSGARDALLEGTFCHRGAHILCDVISFETFYHLPIRWLCNIHFSTL